MQETTQGRQCICVPRTGKLDLFIAANRHFKATSSVHCRHLREDLLPKYMSDYGILPPSMHKSVLVAVTDNGPGWNRKFTIKLINAEILWRNTNLDCLIFVMYAAGDSKFNMIERIWSVINKCITGVTLPMTLPGEESAPWKQGLSTTGMMRKMDQVRIQSFIYTVKLFFVNRDSMQNLCTSDWVNTLMFIIIFII